MSSVNLGVQVRDVNVQQGMEDGNIYRCGGEERRAMCDFVGVDQSSTQHYTHTQHNTTHRVQQRRRHQGEGCDSVPRVRLPHSHEEAHDENRSVRSTLNLYDVDDAKRILFFLSRFLCDRTVVLNCANPRQRTSPQGVADLHALVPRRRPRFSFLLFGSSCVCVCTLFGP
jgi:hypothetical protein